MQETVSDEPHSMNNYTGDKVGMFTSTTTAITSDSAILTTATSTTLHHDHNHTDYDEGTIHYAVVVSSLIVFVGLLCSAKSIGNFVRSRRNQRANGTSPTGVRSDSSIFQWFGEDPPPYPGKFSRTDINYLPSYESAIKIANESDQTTLSGVTSGVAETEPVSESPEINNDSGAIMFTALKYMNNSSEPTRSSDFELSNENRENDFSSSHAVNIVDENCLENRMNGSLVIEINVREVTSSGNHVTMFDETSGVYPVNGTRESTMEYAYSISHQRI